MRRCKENGESARYLSKSPLQSARTGMVKGCHTGFNVFFTTSVLWQIVNLEEKEQGRIKRRVFSEKKGGDNNIRMKMEISEHAAKLGGQ